MKSFFKTLKTQAVNAFLFSIFSILFVAGITYAALSWPSSVPSGETAGGKFSDYFNKILVTTASSTDGTVKNAAALWGVAATGWQRRINTACGTNQAVQSISDQGVVSCIDMVSTFIYAWSAGSFSSCTAGVQTRTVQCVRNGSLVVADSFCAGAKPSTTQTCSMTFPMDWYMAGNTNDTTAQRRIQWARTDTSGNLYITDFVDSCCSYASGVRESLVCSRTAAESTNGCWFYAPSGGAYGYTNYGAYGRAKISGTTLTIWTCGLGSCGPSGSAATAADGTLVGSVVGY